MKGYISIVLIAIISLSSVACKNNGEKSTTNGTDYTQEEIFTSPDLSLFQLQGHVKKCIIPGFISYFGDKVMKFSEEGKLISPHYEEIERDQNGAIIEYYDPDSHSTTRIEWKDGKVIGETVLSDDGYFSFSHGYEYDKENNIVQEITARIASPTNYSNYKFDEFGNWISRTAKADKITWEERRYITYYGSDAGQDRLLKYYDNKMEEKIRRDMEREERELQSSNSSDNALNY